MRGEGTEQTGGNRNSIKKGRDGRKKEERGNGRRAFPSLILQFNHYVKTATRERNIALSTNCSTIVQRCIHTLSSHKF